MLIYVVGLCIGLLVMAPLIFVVAVAGMMSREAREAGSRAAEMRRDQRPLRFGVLEGGRAEA